MARRTSTTRSSSAAATTAWSTAAYLGKAGLRTLVLERRDTRRRRGRDVASWRPGVRVPTLAHTVGRLRPSVVRDLDLKRARPVAGRAGRARLRAAAATATRSRSGATRRGPPRGCAAGRAHDAERYAGVRPAGPLAGRLPRRDRGRRRRPTSQAPGLGDALAGLRLGRTFRGLGKHDGRTITAGPADGRSPTSSPKSFETDALQAAIAWRGVQYTSMGPWSAGTTAVLLVRLGRQRRRRGRPDGLRPGRARARWPRRSPRPPATAGVEIRTGAEVARDHVARRAGDRRRRWPTARSSTGRAVVAGHRPEADADRAGRPGRDRAVAALAGRQHPDAGHGRQGQPRPRPACRGSPAAGDDDPRCSAAGSSSRPASTRSSARTTPPSTAGLRTTPMLEATIPSLVDPSLVEGAPDGTHVMSVIVQYDAVHAPRRTWDDAARGARRPGRRDARRATRPGSPASVTARQVLTPLDLERDYGLTGGHPLHGEHGLDQFFLWRPAPRPRPLPAGARGPVPRRRRARTRAAASPGRPARTPRARSSPTSSGAAGCRCRRRPRSAG